MDTANSSRLSPALEVRADGLVLTLAPERSYRIGRDPKSDVAIDDPRVSWRHAVLRTEQDRWLLEDLDSTNGLATQWVTTNTVLQSLASPDIISMTARSRPGSRPDVGSSRNSSDGFVSSSSATFTRFLLPARQRGIDELPQFVADEPVACAADADDVVLGDRLLVLVPGGKMAYFGPPADGLRHFGQPG